tara:strand:+ start:3277 stop:3672 length:396 start_codon:yes stop_codon:yes gene_type:complete
MSKPGKVLKGLCKKLRVRLTVKRNGKRVYKSVKVLKAQCANKKKKVRKRKFGMAPPFIPRIINEGIYFYTVEDDGRIKICYNDESNYHGEFKLEDYGNGNFKIIKHGKGRLWKNGVTYDGEWENDRKKNYM